jgi:hypothetical protein
MIKPLSLCLITLMTFPCRSPLAAQTTSDGDPGAVVAGGIIGSLVAASSAMLILEPSSRLGRSHGVAYGVALSAGAAAGAILAANDPAWVSGAWAGAGIGILLGTTIGLARRPSDTIFSVDSLVGMIAGAVVGALVTGTTSDSAPSTPSQRISVAFAF